VGTEQRARPGGSDDREEGGDERRNARSDTVISVIGRPETTIVSGGTREK